MEEKKYDKNEPSEIVVDEEGNLGELVMFDKEGVFYRINGITEHIIFGIYFSFNRRFED